MAVQHTDEVLVAVAEETVVVVIDGGVIVGAGDGAPYEPLSIGNVMGQEDLYREAPPGTVVTNRNEARVVFSLSNFDPLLPGAASYYEVVYLDGPTPWASAPAAIEGARRIEYFIEGPIDDGLYEFEVVLYDADELGDPGAQVLQSGSYYFSVGTLDIVVPPIDPLPVTDIVFGNSGSAVYKYNFATATHLGVLYTHVRAAHVFCCNEEGSWIYFWDNAGQIWRMRPDGTDAELVYATGIPQAQCSDMEIDSAAQFLFYGNSTLYRLPLDNTGAAAGPPAVLNTGGSNTSGFAIDRVLRRVFRHHGNGDLQSMNYDGSGLFSVVLSTLNGGVSYGSGSGLTIDPENQKLYFFAASDVVQCDYDGANQVVVGSGSSGLNQRKPIVFDREGQRLYWRAQPPGAYYPLNIADPDGSNLQTILGGDSTESVGLFTLVPNP